MTAFPSFRTFFQALRDEPPFPWQERLAERAYSVGWPKTVSVPTGCGKTSVIDSWVWALAAAMFGGGLQPRRLFFVVDRRIVVDDVFAHAERIAARLAHPTADAVAAVATALRSLGGGEPLRVARLRGGLPIDRGWATSLTQPLVCVSTVDQVGSRLLFRGYGLPHAPKNSLSIHAALVGNDALIVLDEAHLSLAFDQTLSQVERERTRASEPLTLPWGSLRMTATPRDDSDAITIDQTDRRDERLRRRLLVRKPLRIREVKPARGDADPVATAATVEAEALLAASNGPQTIGLVVNRVQRARRIAERLRAARPGLDVLLLIGPSRPLERDRLLEQAWGRLRAGRTRSSDDAPLVLVATQTIEVGADLDLDALITECASSDALRQRFGRVDRLGELDGRAQIVVLYQPQKQPDPVYGDALAATWDWLCNLDARGQLDGGVESLAGAPAATRQPAADAPILFPAYVDRWAQTSPLPAHDPDVALFLHGPDTGSPDVGIVWRADLDAVAPDAWQDTVALTPPNGREQLTVGFAAARRWLAALAAGDTDLADVEGAGHNDGTVDGSMRPFLRWRGARNEETGLIVAGELRPGDTVVVPASYGGCDAEGWYPDSTEPVADLAEAAAGEHGERFLRLHPAVLTHHGLTATILDGVLVPSEDDPAVLELDEEALDRALTAVARSPSTLAGIAAGLVGRKRVAVIYPDGSGLVVADRDARAQLDDDESRLAGRAVALDAHERGVAADTVATAGILGLPETVKQALEWAALRHDEGKRDPRFQRLLRGGADALDGDPLAKGGQRVRDARASRLAYHASGLPRGFRHETLSLALADPAHDVNTGLALHLIASHHGLARPFLPSVDDPEPWLDVTEHERVDGDVPIRFWRLTRRYGPWGLALIESVLRLADHERSRKEQSIDG